MSLSDLCGAPEAASEITKLTTSLATYVVNPLLLLLFALGFLVFIWGIVEFLFDINIRGQGGEGNSKNNGKQHMLWGILGMFVMSAAWAIMKLISCTVDQLLK
ncbi:MAG: hypothetical protein Q7S26_00420 [bacterium]|nr:hypothetical protein [bacterium]